MNEPYFSNHLIRPKLVSRACGGWLAIAPVGARLQIGVSAQTEEEAREKFRRSHNEWLRNLAVEDTEKVKAPH